MPPDPESENIVHQYQTDHFSRLPCRVKFKSHQPEGNSSPKKQEEEHIFPEIPPKHKSFHILSPIRITPGWNKLYKDALTRLKKRNETARGVSAAVDFFALVLSSMWIPDPITCNKIIRELEYYSLKKKEKQQQQRKERLL